MKEVIRSTGKRVPGGAYIVTDLESSMDNFLYDPPIEPIDADGYAHYPEVVGLQPREDVYDEKLYHLWDWIGTNDYPWFPDFWEEVRRFGLSRRISSEINFEGLRQNKSRIVGFHTFGILRGSDKLYKRLVKEWVSDTGIDNYICKRNHNNNNEFCIKTLWQLVDRQKRGEKRLHKVSVPCLDGDVGFYYAATIPSWIGAYKAEWVPAAMYNLPIQRVEIIEDPIGGMHERTLKNINETIVDLPVILVSQ